ncbi:MAG: SWIM zinc finger family protein [Ilumatobacteraceae bacterium]
MSYNDREARLVPTLINVLIAGMCDPSRLRRGRDYARQGAVMDVHVESGLLTGFVQGSRPTPYDVVVHVTAATEFEVLQQLVPTARDIRFDCSCPDWDNPCKHAIAVMSAFAERVGHDPQLLATWRGAPLVGAAARTAVVGSRSSRTSQTAPPPKPVITDQQRAEVDAYLGIAAQKPAVEEPSAEPSTAEPSTAEPSTAEPSAAVQPGWRPPELLDLSPPESDGWDEPWASMLDDAIKHLRDHTPAN